MKKRILLFLAVITIYYFCFLKEVPFSMISTKLSDNKDYIIVTVLGISSVLLFFELKLKFVRHLNDLLLLCSLLFVSLIFININYGAVTRVSGNSMNPTVENNSYLVLTYDFTPKRFDIVVVDMSDILNDRYIVKRVIGLPGEHLQIVNNVIYINNAPLEIPHKVDGEIIRDIDVIIPEGSYFLLGDNRTVSMDSRIFGTVNSKRIVGKVINK